MNIFKKIIRKISYLLLRLKAFPAEIILQITNHNEYLRYRTLRGQFSMQYERVRNLDDPFLVTPFWESLNQKLEKALLPFPSWNFLQQPTISQSMVITRGGLLMDVEIEKLKKIYGTEMKRIVRENALGSPLLAAPCILSSHNNIHHAYHIARWCEVSNKDLRLISSVIEWGGGYGNFAKIFLRQSSQTTYTIIDTPLMCCLQWFYLSIVLPDSTINLVSAPNQQLITNGINIIPIGLIADVPLKCELFISTWALSESSDYAQDFVIGKNWFNAKYLLLAYQEASDAIPFGSRLGELAKRAGARIIPIPFVKKSSYAFR